MTKVWETMGFFDEKNLRFESSPYLYSVTDSFLPAPVYEALAHQFRQVLARGLSESYSLSKLARQGTYDAYSYVIPYGDGPASEIFYGRDWFEFIASNFQLRLLPYTLLAFHHHRPFGKAGMMHRDFNIGNFYDQPTAPWGLRAWAHQVPYMRYKAVEPGIRTLARAVAVIYYLDGLDNWREGDGGETGLFTSAAEDSLARKIEPLNNRLLLFENTPFSYHRYLPNGDWARNCLVQWFHVSVEDCLESHRRAPGLF